LRRLEAAFPPQIRKSHIILYYIILYYIILYYIILYYIILKIRETNNEKCFIKFNICLIILGKLNKRGSATQDMHVARERLKIPKNSTCLDTGYPYRFGLSCKLVENSAKLIFLEITGCQIR